MRRRILGIQLQFKMKTTYKHTHTHNRMGNLCFVFCSCFTRIRKQFRIQMQKMAVKYFSWFFFSFFFFCILILFCLFSMNYGWLLFSIHETRASTRFFRLVSFGNGIQNVIDWLKHLDFPFAISFILFFFPFLTGALFPFFLLLKNRNANLWLESSWKIFSQSFENKINHSPFPSVARNEKWYFYL